ncbi:hypothetical protein N0V90_001558 [Kalmusia sp. IMI 367209]|nr:hypothetical protein N0V90_001558 [Kalmusia sp. IMI 367209]
MHRLKNAFTDLTNKIQAHVPNDEKPQASNTSPHATTTSSSCLAWPPKLTCAPQILGEVTDLSARNYPRDLGRSVSLGGKTYYMFGDTFCFNSSGDFLGVTNNSIGLLPDLSAPTKSQYLCPEAKVPEFVPYTSEEKEFCDREENKNENIRLVNWAFGGIIEIPGCGGREGWLFYDQVEIHGATPEKQNGTGVARARVTDPDGAIECERVGAFPLFPSDGPLWGNMSNIAAPDGWTYLLSGKGLDNYMARIRTDADFSDRSNYLFLKKSGAWEPTYTDPQGPFGELAHDVLCGQGQGAIFYVPEFAPQGKPYLWIGCEKFPTSQLCMGAAPRPEGPWETHKLGEMPKITENAKTRYCIYPHLWGSDLSGGRILITWSDDGTMGGKVAAAIFTFALD